MGRCKLHIAAAALLLIFVRNVAGESRRHDLGSYTGCNAPTAATATASWASSSSQQNMLQQEQLQITDT
jgi:hypothetical protein